MCSVASYTSGIVFLRLSGGWADRKYIHLPELNDSDELKKNSRIRFEKRSLMGAENRLTIREGQDQSLP